MRKTGLDLLLVEIGGTHTRCGVCSDGEMPVHVALFDNIDHPDLESVVAAYLGNLDTPPAGAAMAVAAPVHKPSLRLTNLGWTVDPAELKQRFDWSDITLVNDFEALACALPLLAPEELMPLRPGTPAPGAPKVVLGPGTGLGVSALVPGGDYCYPVSGEGGHVTLPATDDRGMEVLQRLRRRHGHVSAERILSGPGLLTLYQLLSPEPRADSPSAVTRLAADGDEHATKTLAVFFHFLGVVAGDAVLTLGGRGGLYLGGGILPGLRHEPLWSEFIRGFLDKGRFAAYLEPVPVNLIVADTPALRGLAAHPGVRRMFGEGH